MARKKKETVDLRFYEIPQGESVLALLGKEWEKVYGHDENHLHFHNLLEIGVCHRGAGMIQFDDEQLQYKDQMVTVIPENIPHITISEGEEPNAWEYIYLDLHQAVDSLYPNNPIQQNEVLESINGKALLLSIVDCPSLYRAIEGVMDEARNKKSYYESITCEYIQILIYELIRQSGKNAITESTHKKSNGMQIAAALDYINQNYAQPMKANELAAVCDMSETHFRRIFEDYVNMSPMDYVNLIRVQKACERMKKTQDSMDEIAAKCGFATTSTFNRNFKKFLDTSPYQWKINPEHYERKLLNYHITALKGW